MRCPGCGKTSIGIMDKKMEATGIIGIIWGYVGIIGKIVARSMEPIQDRIGLRV